MVPVSHRDLELMRQDRGVGIAHITICAGVGSRGQTTGCPFAARRDVAAAKRFFHKVLGQPHRVNPRGIPLRLTAR
jgi:transposase-like protein